MSRHPFASVAQAEIEPVFAILQQSSHDSSANKVSLMTGSYRCERGQPFVLPAVKLARQKLSNDHTWNHEYPLSQLGSNEYRELSSALFFGQDSLLVSEGRISSMQCMGASGACHMGALFLKLHYEPFKNGQRANVYIPSESWPNHPNVFHHVGLETQSLPWYNRTTASLDFDGLLEAVNSLPNESVVVLQVAGNNPTGCDPSASQWRTLSKIFARRRHFAFFDAAYPGFVTGDVEKDCESVRSFVAAGIPMLLAATHGKTFGLYGERVGILSIICPSSGVATRVEGQMSLLARAETGAPPSFGAAIVEIILSHPELKCSWERSVRGMAEQLLRRRQALQSELMALSPSQDWDPITRQTGMFFFSGLSPNQVRRLREEHHVYILENGRISVSALNTSNIAYVAKSIVAVMK